MNELVVVAVNDKGYSYERLTTEERMIYDAIKRYGIMSITDLIDIMINDYNISFPTRHQYWNRVKKLAETFFIEKVAVGKYGKDYYKARDFKWNYIVMER